jgi:AcrR family transcriptional regulator
VKAPPTQPLTDRGLGTRRAILAGARRVFERDGLLAAKITDIAEEAGVATGSFYTYFRDKDDVFAQILEETREEMLHPDLPEDSSDQGPTATIEAANRAYLLAYRKNARLMGLMNEAAAVDERYRKLLIKRGEAFVKRNAASIARLQEEGLADPGLDPYEASRALSNMVSRTAYLTFVLGQRTPFEKLVETLTRLWVGALRIRQ